MLHLRQFKLFDDFDIGFHASSVDGHLPPVFAGDFYEGDNSFDLGGESGDENASRSVLDDFIYRSLKIEYCSISRSLGIPFTLSMRTSPVATTSPRGVSIITPVESGIE